MAIISNRDGVCLQSMGAASVSSPPLRMAHRERKAAFNPSARSKHISRLARKRVHLHLHAGGPVSRTRSINPNAGPNTTARPKI